MSLIFLYLTEEFDYLCNRYANSKFYCLSLSRLSASQYSKMKLFIIDLTGPIFVPTWNRYLYILVVVKLSCHYTVGYLLKDKEKASIIIQNIMAMMECQSSLKAC